MAKIRKKVKDVEEQAEENLNVVKGKEVKRQGKFIEHAKKHLDGECVGMSIGTTINMGDYESLRIDCWATINRNEGEDIEQALDRVMGVLDKKLRKSISFYTTEN